LTETKQIKIHWIAPNGRHYEDIIPMTKQQYIDFVDNLGKLKQTFGGKC
jgi:hypothetical protein